jgi:hypothetical protein
MEYRIVKVSEVERHMMPNSFPTKIQARHFLDVVLKSAKQDKARSPKAQKWLDKKRGIKIFEKGYRVMYIIVGGYNV